MTTSWFSRPFLYRAAFEQARGSHPFGPLGECAGRPSPPELVRAAEERRAGPERREVLEEEGELPALAEDGGWEALDRPVLVQQSSRGHSANPSHAGVAVLCVADQGEEVGDEPGLDAELLPHAGRVADRAAAAVHLNDPVAADALGEVLVVRPDTHLLHDFLLGSNMRRGREGVVRFQLDHGPNDDSHGGERILERLELRRECGIDALPCFVAGPERVAEGLDDVIGGDADVGSPLLDHLQDCVEHAGDGTERRIFLLFSVAHAVEEAEQLVRAVDEVDDHWELSRRTMASKSTWPRLSRCR